MSPSFIMQWDLLHFSFAGPPWTRRKRDASGEVLMRASRGYERVEEDKTAGCMADGLRCNIWVRVQSPAKLSYDLVKGGAIKGRRQGLQMHDSRGAQHWGDGEEQKHLLSAYWMQAQGRQRQGTLDEQEPCNVWLEHHECRGPRGLSTADGAGRWRAGCVHEIIRTDTYDTYEYVRKYVRIRTNTKWPKKIQLCTYRTYCVRIFVRISVRIRMYRTYSYVFFDTFL